LGPVGDRPVQGDRRHLAGARLRRRRQVEAADTPGGARPRIALIQARGHATRVGLASHAGYSPPVLHPGARPFPDLHPTCQV
jgi:hypothetical protein